MLHIGSAKFVLQKKVLEYLEKWQWSLTLKMQWLPSVGQQWLRKDTAEHKKGLESDITHLNEPTDDAAEDDEKKDGET